MIARIHSNIWMQPAHKMFTCYHGYNQYNPYTGMKDHKYGGSYIKSRMARKKRAYLKKEIDRML